MNGNSLEQEFNYLDSRIERGKIWHRYWYNNTRGSKDVLCNKYLKDGYLYIKERYGDDQK